MSSNGYDPRAWRVAQELHAVEQPEITILFGSRARGDWEEGRSDIDIMLVDASVPDREKRQALTDQAEAQAAAVYGGPVKVQITPIASALFNRMHRSVNHVAARAWREGVIMPRPRRRPEEFNPDYRAEHDITEERLEQGAAHLRVFNLTVEHDPENDIVIGQQAQNVMEHALKALISAAGQEYAVEHRIEPLTAAARAADPELDFELLIPGQVFDQYVGVDEYLRLETPDLTTYPDYREIVNNAAQLLMERARQLGAAREL